MAESKTIRLITPVGRLSYPVLETPRPNERGELQYSTAVVFDDQVDLSEIERAIKEVAIDRFGKDAVSQLEKGKLRNPLRDDWEEKGYPEGSRFFNARSTKKPGVVAAYADPRTGKPAVIENVGEVVYPGIFARASVTFYAYDKKGNKGVGVGLNNIQILGGGDRFDTGRAASDEFDAVAPAPDLSDLEEGDPLKDLA